MQRVLILMSDTGGGHRASAQALATAFGERYGDRFNVQVIDLWSHYTPWPVNQVPKSYRTLVTDALWLWKLAWRASERDWLTEPGLRLVGRLVRRAMRRAFDEYQPDVVISVHPLMQHAPLGLLRHRLKSPIPFVTVVTDLISIAPVWYHREVDRCFVASQEAVRRAKLAGLGDEQIRLYGLPVRPAFARPVGEKKSLRLSLGLEADCMTALLVGGGEGMGPVGEIARSMAARLAADGRAAQLVVICGRNEALRRELAAHRWPLPVRVEGFVQNMPEWMAASDCVVTKAGPGTIAEALICGLPILLTGFIPGQEEGNVPFVVENGVGIYSESPAQIGAILSRWFGPERERLAAMGAKAKTMGRPQATFEIVEEIARLLGE
ncbi:MAG: glycosyltransferase [Chloroflexi bacterium]|nr:glycosyltransferase [Chloroflexota bacterium]